LSQNQISIAIKSFFEKHLNESYLLIYVFHSKIEIMEKENNSIWEILSILSVENALYEQKQQKFLPLKVKEIFKNNYNQSSHASNLKKEMLNVYDHGLCYLKKWTANFYQFNCLK